MKSTKRSSPPSISLSPSFNPPKKQAVIPIFDDQPPSEIPSSYMLDLEFPEPSARLISSPRFQLFLTKSYSGAGPKSPTSPPHSVKSFLSLDAPSSTPRQHEKQRQLTSFPHPSDHDDSETSFSDVEAECSALQLGSSVVVLSRHPSLSKSPLSLPISGTRSGLSLSRPKSPTMPESRPREPGSRYQRKAPPPLHLKASTHHPRVRRYSGPRCVIWRTNIRPAPTPVPSPASPSDRTSPPCSSSLPLSPSPTSATSSRLSSYNSLANIRTSRIQPSAKELQRRRILKLQKTFGEHVPLELISLPAPRPSSSHDHVKRQIQRQESCPPPPFVLLVEGEDDETKDVGDTGSDCQSKPSQPPSRPAAHPRRSSSARASTSSWTSPRRRRKAPLEDEVSDSDSDRHRHPLPTDIDAREVQPLETPAVQYWPRTPFAHAFNPDDTLQRSASCSSKPLRPSNNDLLRVPTEGVTVKRSGSWRSERRQGWSGEWNQPSIQDVIQKLRDI